MPGHEEIYRIKTEKYEELISKEDYLGNIRQTLFEICSFENCDVIDIGAGTGRLTCMVAPLVKSIAAFDLSQSMLDIIAKKLKMEGLTNWTIEVADHRSLPSKNNSADIIMAGWSISYLGENIVPNWQENIQLILGEMKRVIRKNGFLIIFETYGTGKNILDPPESLIQYYNLLTKFGFNHKVIETDYKFNSFAEAQDLTKFFFGDKLSFKTVDNKAIILPEFTGVWWLKA